MNEVSGSVFMTMEVNAETNVWRECQIYYTVSSLTILNLWLDTVRVTTCDAKKTCHQALLSICVSQSCRYRRELFLRILMFLL